MSPLVTQEIANAKRMLKEKIVTNVKMAFLISLSNGEDGCQSKKKSFLTINLPKHSAV
jgi:hypothetical protein